MRASWLHRAQRWRHPRCENSHCSRGNFISCKFSTLYIELNRSLRKKRKRKKSWMVWKIRLETVRFHLWFNYLQFFTVNFGSQFSYLEFNPNQISDTLQRISSQTRFLARVLVSNKFFKKNSSFPGRALGLLPSGTRHRLPFPRPNRSGTYRNPARDSTRDPDQKPGQDRSGFVGKLKYRIF